MYVVSLNSFGTMIVVGTLETSLSATGHVAQHIQSALRSLPFYKVFAFCSPRPFLGVPLISLTFFLLQPHILLSPTSLLLVLFAQCVCLGGGEGHTAHNKIESDKNLSGKQKSKQFLYFNSHATHTHTQTRQPTKSLKEMRGERNGKTKCAQIFRRFKKACTHIRMHTGIKTH